MTTTADFYSPQTWIAAFDVASTGELPNVAGATLQTPALRPLQLATVRGSWYCCSVATVGSAAWFYIQAPPNPLIRRRIQIVATTPTAIEPGVTDVYVTCTDATTLTLGTVLAGFPINANVRVIKANTSTNGISVDPDDASSINGGTAGAVFALPLSTVASSTTTSDMAYDLVRLDATNWRCDGPPTVTQAGAVPTTRTISTTAPLTGGGDLSANRTFAIPAATPSINGYMTAAQATAVSIGRLAATTQTISSGTTGTIAATDRIVLIDTSAGAFSLTCAAMADGHDVKIFKTSTDANTITLIRTTTETINGVAGDYLIASSVGVTGYLSWVLSDVAALARVVTP